VSTTLPKALIAFLPVSALLAGSAVLFLRSKSLGVFLQLSGAVCLFVVVLIHVCEALALFPSMHWGRPRSAGHYIDLSFAVLGLILFPVGYLFHALARRNSQQT
jgi:hypothetical protein